jgi:uncharacterized membrane protein
MAFSSKVLLAKLEKSGSLNQIIWIFFGVLAVVVLLILFSDSLFPQKGFETEYGTYEGKNQSIYLEK